MRARAPTTARRVLVLAALALLGLAVSSALAQGTGEIQIEPPDGSDPVTVSLDEVDGSLNTEYPVRDGEGNVRRISITPDNGAALDDFLKAAGFDERYVYLHVGDVRLSRMRVRSGRGQDGLVPAIYVDEEGTHFVRPPLGPGDDNAADVVTVSGPLLVRQSVESMLGVEVKASKRKLAAGDAVTFAAEVTGGGIGDRFEYTWRFGDGSDVARTRRVRHAFEDAGRYRVRVRVETRDDLVDGAVTIQVGEPEESDEDHEGGGTNEADDAPSSGSYEGDSGAGGSYDSGGAAGSFDYSTDDYSTDDYSTDDYSTDDYATEPLPSDSQPPATSAEPTIEGNLLADISTPPTAAASAAREGTPREEPVDPAGVPTAAWALGTALGLLGVGAGIESGRLRAAGAAGRLRRRRPAAPGAPGASGLRARLRALLRR